MNRSARIALPLLLVLLLAAGLMRRGCAQDDAPPEVDEAVAPLMACIDSGRVLILDADGAPICEPARAVPNPGIPLWERRAYGALGPAPGGLYLSIGLPMPVNTVPPEVLAGLPGVGDSLARAIVAARPLGSPEDLDRVAGIGPARVAELAPLLDFRIP